MKQIRNLIDRKCPNYWVENILSTIRDIRESLGKPIDEDAERAKIIKEYEETVDIANSIDISEKYSNYWFLWYYGDNDFSSASELAVKYVANQYVDLLKQDLHNLAGTVWTYQDYQKKNEDTIRLQTLTSNNKFIKKKNDKTLNKRFALVIFISIKKK